MKVLVNSIMTRGLDMKKVIEEVTKLDVEYCLIGNTLYIDSSNILESAFESAQNVLRFDTEQENNGMGWEHVFGCNNFKEIVIKTAEVKGLEYEYFNPEVLCIEYITNAHFNSGRMDSPDKYFVNRNDDLEEIAENLGWIKYGIEGTGWNS